MLFKELLDSISKNPECELFESEGPASIAPHLTLPSDLEEFFALCGGCILFKGQDYSIRIVGPTEFICTNRLLIPEENIVNPNERSESWYVIGRDENVDQSISIDLSSTLSNGRCYDSFHEVHGIPGSMQIIARSFTELLSKLYHARGKSWYWLQPEFKYQGDAYDT